MQSAVAVRQTSLASWLFIKAKTAICYVFVTQVVLCVIVFPQWSFDLLSAYGWTKIVVGCFGWHVTLLAVPLIVGADILAFLLLLLDESNPHTQAKKKEYDMRSAVAALKSSSLFSFLLKVKTVLYWVVVAPLGLATAVLYYGGLAFLAVCFVWHVILLIGPLGVGVAIMALILLSLEYI